MFVCVRTCMHVDQSSRESVCVRARACDLDLHLQAHLSVSSQMFLYGSMTGERVCLTKETISMGPVSGGVLDS